MRRDDPGRQAGPAAGTTAPDRPAGPDGDADDRGTVPTEPRPGVLTSGAADQLAALVARAARAPGGLIHLVEDRRLRLYGTWGVPVPGADDPAHRADTVDGPGSHSLAGVVASTGEPLIIPDIRAVPEGSPIRRSAMTGAYLAHPVHDPDGAVLGICCAFDPAPRTWTPDEIAAVAAAAQAGTLLITEQLTRHDVDRQRRFLDAVVDNLHDGVTACDANGTVVLVNARMRRMWGDARMPADNAVIEDLYDAAGAPLKRDDLPLFRALHGERLRDEELVFRRRSRQTRHYLVDAQPITGADGMPVGAVQAVQDVTRRKRAERFRLCELAVTAALAEARSIEAAGPRVLEAVVTTLDWAHAELWLVDDAAGVVRPAARWSAPGWPEHITVPADLPYGQGLPGRAWQVGKPLWIRDVEQPQSLISSATAAASHLHTALAVPVRHGFEPLGVLTMFADSVEDPDDEVMALMSGIAAHIGQFVERRIVEDLQRQLVRSKNEYLALIGHELRTPLTSISAYTEILRESDPEALVSDGPRLLEVVERNTNQLRYIINELLELSALDTGHAEVQLAPVDLADVVRESVATTRDAVDGEPVTIDTDLPDRLVLPGDRRRLRQIVDNLLGNAVKYSPDGGTVSVSLRSSGRAAELTVSDTGIGVPPEEREKMFTGLYRTSRARDRAIPGTGLGLTLSRAVVHRHHGTIELTEHDGPGTTVLVRLPLEPR